MNHHGLSQDEFFYSRLRTEFADRLERNPRYSLRAFARTLGLSPGALSQIMAAKRFPSIALTEKIATLLGLEPEERVSFLASITEMHRARALKRIPRALKNLKPSPPAWNSELPSEAFRVLSDWHHFAILELTFLPGFQAKGQWIASQLGISKAEAVLALQRIMGLGILTCDGRGKWRKKDALLASADPGLTSSAHRKRQRQILEKAIVALEETPFDERDQSAVTMAIDPSRIPEAKRRIREFRRELCAFLEGGKRERVYELSISLFPLQTEKLTKKNGRKD